MSKIVAKIQVYCKKCGSEILYNYSNDDIQRLEYLDFNCQSCGFHMQVKSESFLKAAKYMAMKQLQSELDKK